MALLTERKLNLQRGLFPRCYDNQIDNLTRHCNGHVFQNSKSFNFQFDCTSNVLISVYVLIQVQIQIQVKVEVYVQI